MPRLQVTTRKWVIILRRQGYSIREIHNRLIEEGTEVSICSLQRLCVKFQIMHTVQDLPRNFKARLRTPEVVAIIEESIRNDDELTARKLKCKLGEKFAAELPDVSLSTIKRCRREIGWICTRPHYCQLIRENNKVKRKEWCQKQSDNRKILKILFSQMNVQSSLIIMDVLASVKKKNNVC